MFTINPNVFVCDKIFDSNDESTKSFHFNLSGSHQCSERGSEVCDIWLSESVSAAGRWETLHRAACGCPIPSANY